jgi:hypothetical protein
MSAIDEIATERRRQIEAEGWTAEHDDAHANGELAKAAGCYALYDNRKAYPRFMPPEPWPFDWCWWKPANRRRDLVRAAALIIAEIERMDRADALLSALEGGEHG